MTPPPADDRVVTVVAPARLHFGMLDLRGSLGRIYGGIGAAVPSPSLWLEASHAETIEAEGPDAPRAAEFARRFLAHHQLGGGARITVRRALPPHSGLGSGTQLALAVARALCELRGVGDRDPSRLTRSVGRAQRSAIGTWAFSLGGFILEGGRRRRGGPDAGDHPAPLLARLPMPETWRCVIAIPRALTPGMSGASEAAAFAHLPLPTATQTERVAHLVLMALLPALVEHDLDAFGDALSEIQRINGDWFSHVQGGRYAPGGSGGLIEIMRSEGARGVGQSSWGPAVYGIFGERDQSESVADHMARLLEREGGRVYEVPFANEGARVTTSNGPAHGGS